MKTLNTHTPESHDKEFPFSHVRFGYCTNVCVCVRGSVCVCVRESKQNNVNHDIYKTTAPQSSCPETKGFIKTKDKNAVGELGKRAMKSLKPSPESF